MRILAITFDSEFSGGANRSFLMVINNLKNRFGHDVCVIVPNQGPLIDQLENNNLDYKVIKLRMPGVVLKGETKDILRIIKTNYNAFNNYLTALKECRKLKEKKFDIVYINGTSQLFGYYMAKKLNIPYVWHFRGFLTPQHRYVWNQKKIFNDSNGKIVVISKSMIQTLPETLGINNGQLVLIHNGLPCFTGEISARNVEQHHFLVCGRLISLKGQRDAIEAFHILKGMGYDNIFLHFAGDIQSGNQEYISELKNLIVQYDLDDIVIFEGQINDMPEFRKKMNCELVCSKCEPFGRVTVEAMQSGLVVIGANTGGTLDIITSGENGLLFEQGNSKDLADKIALILNNKDLADKLSKNAVEFSKTHFTELENVSRINALLTKLIVK